MAADWEEIKRLAADFQRAQLSSTVQRLSERNCVEIVRRLQALGLLEVIYTCDGKQYLTPQELAKEIREELIVQSGRVNLVDLQQTLNVDFSHIESKVNEIVSNDSNLIVVLGQLIDQSYLDSMAEQINDKLQERGQVTMTEITKEYNLPGDFLAQVVTERLGVLIHGHVDDFDRNLIYTDAFVARYQAQIRGSFSAISKPIAILNVMNQYNMQERLFFKILSELVSSKRLRGSLTGGKADKAQYIPDNFLTAQNQWVDAFYQQNGYLEYDALRRLGVGDAAGFVKRRYGAADLTHLTSCCVGPSVRERLDAELQVLVGSAGWLDAATLLPSVLSPSDISQLLQSCTKSHKGLVLLCDTLVAGDQLLSCCERLLDQTMKTKADKDAKSNSVLLSASGDKKMSSRFDNTKDDRKEERRKKAAGANKSGMGTQGREVKMKAVKKKGQRGRDADLSDGDDNEPGPTSSKQQQVLPFLSVDELQTHLREADILSDAPEEMVVEIAEMLHRPLTARYQEVARSVFLQSTGSGTSSDRRKTHGELTEKITSLWLNAKLFEKGIKIFTADDTQAQLTRHLLRTVCTDVVNLVFCEVAADNMIAIGADESQLTADNRMKLLNKVGDEATKTILKKLHSSINGQSLDEFFEYMDLACAPDQLGILLRKTDRKKERQLLQSHREMLRSQLRDESSPAMTFHLVCVLLVIAHGHVYVHAPGRCVPQLCSLLGTMLTADDFGLLQKCQDLVVKQLKQKTEEGNSGDANESIDELLQKVKDMALNIKKVDKTDE